MVSLVSSSSIKSLRDYIGDKKEMIEIMFSCIEDNQLKRMIPDVLKVFIFVNIFFYNFVCFLLELRYVEVFIMASLRRHDEYFLFT